MNKEIMFSFNVLKAVYIDGAYSSIELNKLLKNSAMEKVNTHLITKIVYGVLEKDIYLDYAINQFCKKRPDEITEILLKMGIYILKNINSIPSFACVNEMVELCKKNNSKFVSGFLNATLKSVASSDIKPPSKNNKIKYLSIMFSYPEWFIEKLVDENGYEFVENMLKTELTTLTHIRISNLISKEEFLNKLNDLKISYENSPLVNCLFVDYSELIKYKELNSFYAVQGIPSIVVCDNFPTNKTCDILDVCSAPGGKSVLIASNNPNSRIVSCDIYDKRLLLVKEYAFKYGIKNIGYKVNDATIINEKWINKFDYILCDVPCSNLGVCNKKPDILLRKTPNNVKTLQPIQSKILETSSNYLKKGGILIYSTCTILNEENKDVLNKFLGKHKDFELIDINTSSINTIVDNKMCTFYPHISNTEGFFIGGLKRI